MISITCGLFIMGTSGRAYCGLLTNFARVCFLLRSTAETKNESLHNFTFALRCLNIKLCYL